MTERIRLLRLYQQQQGMAIARQQKSGYLKRRRCGHESGILSSQILLPQELVLVKAGDVRQHTLLGAFNAASQEQHDLDNLLVPGNHIVVCCSTSLATPHLQLLATAQDLQGQHHGELGPKLQNSTDKKPQTLIATAKLSQKQIG